MRMNINETVRTDIALFLSVSVASWLCISLEITYFTSCHFSMHHYFMHELKFHRMLNCVDKILCSFCMKIVILIHEICHCCLLADSCSVDRMCWRHIFLLYFISLDSEFCGFSCETVSDIMT